MWRNQIAPNGRAVSSQLGDRDTDPYAAYCVDEAIRIFGEWADGEMRERMSELDDEGHPINQPEDVYREVMGIELSPAEKRAMRNRAREQYKMMHER